MLYITSREEINKYREVDALNQSDLKKLLLGMDKFLDNKEVKMTNPMIIGNAVDTILTGEEEDFENNFYLLNYPKPTDSISSILEETFNRVISLNVPSTDLEDNLDILKEVIISYEYQSNWKLETRINKILEHTGYYKDLQNSLGKIILSEEQKSIIDNIVDSLKNNIITSSYFDRKLYAENTSWDMYLQLPIYWEYKGVNCKGLLDIVIVKKDKSGKIERIIPIDLKVVMDKTLSFLNNAKTGRYDIQAAFYTLGLLSSKDIPFEVNKENLLNFRFVVESVDTGNPIVYETSDSFLSVGANGLSELWLNDRLIRQEVLGYNQLIDLYLYYQEQGWKQEKLIYDNSGFLSLGWEKIYV